jgi:beta-alanine degradation protein BauB
MSNAPFRADLTKCPWPEWLQDEFRKQYDNVCVGTVLAAESERARVWHLRLPPGKRIPFHTHVLDYFWTCISGGQARSHVAQDGKFEIAEFDLKPGSTRFENYAAGRFKTHDLENIGKIDLVFVTVEFKQSANAPLPVPESVRMQPHDGLLQPAY